MENTAKEEGVIPTAFKTERVTNPLSAIPFLIISVSILLAVSREIRLWYELLTRK